jgi:hypothetical protein
LVTGTGGYGVRCDPVRTYPNDRQQRGTESEKATVGAGGKLVGARGEVAYHEACCCAIGG